MSKIKGLLEDSKLPLTEIVNFKRFTIHPVRGLDIEYNVVTKRDKAMMYAKIVGDTDETPLCWVVYGCRPEKLNGEDVLEEHHIADFDTAENAGEFLKSLTTLFSVREVAEAHAVMVAVWGVEDIKHQAKCDGVELTDDQCRDILGELQRKHDATIGVNWEVISVFIDAYLN